MPELAVGTHLYSQVCPAEVIVVRAPTGSVELVCGGLALTDDAAAANSATGDLSGPGLKLGKRYATDDGLELLCVKAGAGSLSADGVAISMKSAKPLPASD